MPIHAAHSRAHSKESKYAEEVARIGARFVPLVIETYGAMTPAFTKLLTRFTECAVLTGARCPPSFIQMRNRIVRALVVGTAAMDAAGLRSFHSNHGTVPVAPLP